MKDNLHRQPRMNQCNQYGSSPGGAPFTPLQPTAAYRTSKFSTLRQHMNGMAQTPSGPTGQLPNFQEKKEQMFNTTQGFGIQQSLYGQSFHDNDSSDQLSGPNTQRSNNNAFPQRKANVKYQTIQTLGQQRPPARSPARDERDAAAMDSQVFNPTPRPIHAKDTGGPTKISLKNFEETTINVIQKQKADYWAKDLEKKFPSIKYNPKVLGILGTRSNAPSISRKRSPIGGRGGGAHCPASPRKFSVIPNTRVLQINLDLKIQSPLSQHQASVSTARSQKPTQQPIALINNKNSVFKQQRAFNSLVMNEFEEREHYRVQDKFLKQVNDHYEWLETSILSNSIENQRLKQKILDYSLQSELGTIMSKLWYALLHLNYGREDIKENISDCLIIPMNLGVYSIGFKLIIKAMGPALFASERYLVYKDSNYKRKYAQYDRFKFDVCSLISAHIDQASLDVDKFEIVLREIFKSITFHQTRDQVLIKSFVDVKPIDLSLIADSQPAIDQGGSKNNIESTISQANNDRQGTEYNEEDTHQLAQSNEQLATDAQLYGEITDNQCNIVNPSAPSFHFQQNSDQSCSMTIYKAAKELRQVQVQQNQQKWFAEQYKPLILDGFKLEKIEQVMESRENRRYIDQLKKNLNPFNPNNQIVIERFPDRPNRTQSPCSKGHPKEMNYQVNETKSRGLKEMVTISRDIIARKKQKGKKSARRGSSPIMSEFGAQTGPNDGCDASTSHNPARAFTLDQDLKGFHPIAHRKVMRQDIKLGGGPEKNSFLSQGINIQPGHSRVKKIYDKFMYTMYKGGKADDPSDGQNNALSPMQNYPMTGRIMDGRELGAYTNGGGSQEPTFEFLDHEYGGDALGMTHPQSSENQQNDENKEKEKPAPNPREDNAIGPISKYIDKDHNKIGDDLQRENVDEAVEAMRIKDEIGDEQNKFFLEKVAKGPVDLEKHADRIVVTDQEQDLMISERIKQQEQEERGSRRVHNVNTSETNKNDTGEAGAADSAILRGSQTKSGEARSRYSQKTKKNRDNNDIDGVGLIKLGSKEHIGGDTGRFTASPTKTRTPMNGDRQSKHSKGGDSKRKKIYSRVSHRSQSKGYNLSPEDIAENDHAGAYYEDQSLNDEREPAEGYEMSAVTPKMQRSPVFSKRERRGIGMLREEKDFQFHNGNQQEINFIDSESKLFMSQQKTSQLISAQQQQRMEQEKIEKYKKFEKINDKTKMICSQIPGVDGYKQTFVEQKVDKKFLRKGQSSVPPGLPGQKSGSQLKPQPQGTKEPRSIVPRPLQDRRSTLQPNGYTVQKLNNRNKVLPKLPNLNEDSTMITNPSPLSPDDVLRHKFNYESKVAPTPFTPFTPTSNNPSQNPFSQDEPKFAITPQYLPNQPTTSKFPNPNQMTGNRADFQTMQNFQKNMKRQGTRSTVRGTDEQNQFLEQKADVNDLQKALSPVSPSSVTSTQKAANETFSPPGMSSAKANQKAYYGPQIINSLHNSKNSMNQQSTQNGEKSGQRIKSLRPGTIYVNQDMLAQRAQKQKVEKTENQNDQQAAQNAMLPQIGHPTNIQRTQIFQNPPSPRSKIQPTPTLSSYEPASAHEGSMVHRDLDAQPFDQCLQTTLRRDLIPQYTHSGNRNTILTTDQLNQSKNQEHDPSGQNSNMDPLDQIIHSHDSHSVAQPDYSNGQDHGIWMRAEIKNKNQVRRGPAEQTRGPESHVSGGSNTGCAGSKPPQTAEMGRSIEESLQYSVAEEQDHKNLTQANFNIREDLSKELLELSQKGQQSITGGLGQRRNTALPAYSPKMRNPTAGRSKAVVDMRLMFQRKNVQDMKRQNREAVTRQRREQNDNKKISQFKLAQEQYTTPTYRNKDEIKSKQTPIKQKRQQNYRFPSTRNAETQNDNNDQHTTGGDSPQDHHLNAQSFKCSATTMNSGGDLLPNKSLDEILAGHVL